MKRALLVTLLLLACNKTDGASGSASASASNAPPPPPFTGTLTGERIMGSTDLVRPFDAWAGAQAKLEAQMGKATLVKENRKFIWGVKTGDDCWYTEIDKQADGTVGATTTPMKVSKGGPIFNWDDCLTAAGVRKDPVEDPSAAGPPTDGKAIGVIDLRDGATKGRSKWSKAKVTVKGLYMSTTNMESNGVASANVSITAAKADLKNVVACDLKDAATAPTKLMQYTPIVVTGTVDVEDMLTGGGDKLIDVGLKDCSITK